jgi:hypothetical protein
MIRKLAEPLLGRDLDLGERTVTSEAIAQYMRAVADPHPVEAPRVAPPTFCLRMRWEMSPMVTLPPGTFGIAGGHDLEFCHPIRAGETYRIRGRVADIYEKIGRSGTLTVVVRQVEIADCAGHAAVRMLERQIVRQRPPVPDPRDPAEAAPVSPDAGGGEGFHLPPADAAPRAEEVIDLGHELGPRRRPTPSAAAINDYIGTADIREPFFADTGGARALGFRDIVVPGPMLSAFLEHFVRLELPTWRLERLSTTYRVPTITGDVVVLAGVVTERHELPDGERLVCDLVIEHADGERAVTGTATLRR